MSKKDLVLELRERANYDGPEINGHNIPGCILASEIMDEDCKDCAECHKAVFLHIANRIEREYLPRPLFEDGEPVQFGDEFMRILLGERRSGVVDSIRISCDGTFEVIGIHKNGGIVRECCGEGHLVMRPKEPDTLEKVARDMANAVEVCKDLDAGISREAVTDWLKRLEAMGVTFDE